MKEESTPTPDSLFVRGIPRELKLKFKAWCAEHGITMTDKVVELLKSTVELLEKEEPKPRYENEKGMGRRR